jgi:hypothetical protein
MFKWNMPQVMYVYVKYTEIIICMASDGRSVGIVRSRTQTMDLVLFFSFYAWNILQVIYDSAKYKYSYRK